MNNLDPLLSAPPMRAAIKEAKKSKQKIKVGAAIARKNKVLAAAHNLVKTHPRFGSKEFKTLHAEGHAIYKAIRAGIDICGCSIYVYRGKGTLAKPCPCCTKLIFDYGIKTIYYSGE